ncbi:hypothetical protein FRB96_003499 [Tulasnella sp. 330]|nr:hypothetical protein FRB96_003499 [Tulasnella sp. 330]KAG8885504.1 hypothetical protein FRB97_000829 [Tulasnella sp. 331]KAG8890310.1 hypothetical protein FRB98_009378 [Tulasnella sp. 332]
MSDLKAEGFNASPLIEQLGAALAGLSEKDRQAEVKKSKAIFEIQLKNKEGTEQCWVIDLKKDGAVTKGKAAKSDVTLIMEATFVDLANGKIAGQKAFMTGKLKTKGNMMLATKLEGVLKIAQQSTPKAKL